MNIIYRYTAAFLILAATTLTAGSAHAGWGNSPWKDALASTGTDKSKRSEYPPIFSQWHRTGVKAYYLAKP